MRKVETQFVCSSTSDTLTNSDTKDIPEDTLEISLNILSFSTIHTPLRPDTIHPSQHATSSTFTKILPHHSSFHESASNPNLASLTDLLYFFTFATEQPVPVVLDALRNLPDGLSLNLLLRTIIPKQVRDLGQYLTFSTFVCGNADLSPLSTSEDTQPMACALPKNCLCARNGPW